jgi:hypothetical protein
MKNVVAWDIKSQFVLHRRHITSPVQSYHGSDYEECRLLGYKTQFVLHRRHIKSPLQSPAS